MLEMGRLARQTNPASDGLFQQDLAQHFATSVGSGTMLPGQKKI